MFHEVSRRLQALLGPPCASAIPPVPAGPGRIAAAIAAVKRRRRALVLQLRVPPP